MTLDVGRNEAVWLSSRFLSSSPLLVTRLWKAYLLSSGLLSPLSEVIRAELGFCWHLSLLHHPHRPDGGPPPAESLKEHSLWSAVVYECSRRVSRCLEKIVTGGTHSEDESTIAGLWCAEAVTVLSLCFFKGTWKGQTVNWTSALFRTSLLPSHPSWWLCFYNVG